SYELLANLYVSIYRRPATQPLGLRWGFETTSKQSVPAHAAKRHVMVPGGRFMAENDMSC
ncbi:MAG: hypothetical protein PVF78_11880, partial [Desulfobacterales bacterium]